MMRHPRTLPRPPILGVAALALLLTSCVNLPNLDRILERAVRQAESTFVYAADGSLITSLHDVENREIVPLDQVPLHVRQAVVAIEDARFFSHSGVDLRAVARAIFHNTAAGRVVEGGSTITQQYIKNALITRGRNLKGKMEEAALAFQLERKYSKEEILGFYLNTVYFGQGAYGIEAASLTFFGVHARELTVPQGALLAGLIRSPTRYDPYTTPDAALARRNLVIGEMRKQGYLDDAAAQAASATPVTVQSSPRPDRYPFGYFVDYVKDLLQRDARFNVLGETLADRVNAIFKGGLRIYTTIDPRMQQAAERSSREVLTQKKDPYNAFVGMDPRTGEIRAMVGGRDYFDSSDPYAKFNLAVQGQRQPGSSFKTFTLVAALEDGIPLERIYKGGSVIQIPLPNGTIWPVHNYESLSFGAELSLREATIKSVNVVYAQLVMQLGPEKVVEVARKMGITSPLKPLHAIAIGAQEVNTLEMASAYSVLANGGYAAPPIAITKITDARGKVLYEWHYQQRRVLEPAVVALATDALADVINLGTGRREQLGRPAAGKTGTADEYHDAWFAGFVPQLVGVSWVGFPKAQISMYPPNTRIKVVGGSWPGQIWKGFMQEALKGTPPMDFPVTTDDLVRVRIDITRNCLPNPYTPPALIQEQVYIKGSEPKKQCTEPSTGAIAAPNVIGKAKADALDVLGKAGYVVSAQPRLCPSYPNGFVCDQDPPPGSQGTVGQPATIYVSDDQSVGTIPMVLGKSLQQATEALQAAGFQVEPVTQANPDGSVDIAGCRDPDAKTSGRVWLQTFCAGEQRPKGSVVRLYVNP